MPPRIHPSRIRNIGIVAHVDAGKTTCTERLLFLSGKLHRTGEVHDGNTTTDYSPMERKRGITINSACASFDWTGHRVQLIDTPGHVDFSVEVERSLRVLDGAVFLLDAKNGVECQTEMVSQRADRHGVPRLVFVNKMDTLGADFRASVASIHERLGQKAIPIQLPLGEEAAHAGVIDLIEMQARVFDVDPKGKTYRTAEIPSSALGHARLARQELVEVCAELDDEVLRAWLAGEVVSAPALERALRKGTLDRTIVPVLCGSAYKNKGMPLLLDAVVKFLPSPIDVPAARGTDPTTGATATRATDPSAPMSALAFKTTASKTGQATLLRMYSSTLVPGMAVSCPTRNDKERVARIFEVFADKSEPVEAATAGMIVAVSGLRDVRTGDTLCERDHPSCSNPCPSPSP